MDVLKSTVLKTLPPFLTNSRMYDILGETPETMNDVFPSRTFEVVVLPFLTLMSAC